MQSSMCFWMEAMVVDYTKIISYSSRISNDDFKKKTHRNQSDIDIGFHMLRKHIGSNTARNHGHSHGGSTHTVEPRRQWKNRREKGLDPMDLADDESKEWVHE